MSEFEQPDPSGTGGPDGDYDIVAEAEGILGGSEPAEAPRVEAVPEVPTVDTAALHEVEVKAERQTEIQRNLHDVWTQADAMASAWHPETQLMFSGVTTDMKMARTIDLYRTPDGGFLAYAGRFMPGTQQAQAVQCQIVAFRDSTEMPGDYEIKMTNPLMFDKEGRPVEFILRVATQLPRAMAEAAPDHKSLLSKQYRRRTNLQALKTNLTGKPIAEDLRMQDLKLIEGRDMQIALGEDPPYRKGLLNVGAADRAR